MNHIVDLHIHSHYARATSKEMNITSIYRWGKIKGISIIGTGDFTHPAWFVELQEKLEPAEPGLFVLKEQYRSVEDNHIPLSCRAAELRFMVTVEVSTIYVRHGRLRKVHSLLIVPDFKTAKKINTVLSSKGKLHIDGRPVLSMDTAELLKIALDSHPDTLFIPAHVWTPWFGVFGSKSGFDSLEDAFGELANSVYALETGLSSDPPMNRRISAHDTRAIVSFSDAHSPQKLGREATIIDSALNYAEIIGAIKTNDQRLVGTIEFFPEEGKYHYDGHRVCGVSCSPAETRRRNGICPVCGKQLTVGVENRVEDLADRTESELHNLFTMSQEHVNTATTQQLQFSKTIEYIIPLTELIAQIKNIRSSTSKTVQTEYHKIIATFGDEFSILRTVPIESIREKGFYELASALENMRAGVVERTPGFDGVYGSIKVPFSIRPQV